MHSTASPSTGVSETLPNVLRGMIGLFKVGLSATGPRVS